MAKFGTNASGILLLAAEITQVEEAIPWVRCASGNVLHLDFTFKKLKNAIGLHRRKCTTISLIAKDLGIPKSLF